MPPFASPLLAGALVDDMSTVDQAFSHKACPTELEITVDRGVSDVAGPVDVYAPDRGNLALRRSRRRSASL